MYIVFNIYSNSLFYQPAKRPSPPEKNQPPKSSTSSRLDPTLYIVRTFSACKLISTASRYPNHLRRRQLLTMLIRCRVPTRKYTEFQPGWQSALARCCVLFDRPAGFSLLALPCSFRYFAVCNLVFASSFPSVSQRDATYNISTKGRKM